MLFVVIGIIILLLVAAVWILSPYPPLPSELTYKADRLAFASILIEVAAVVAFTLAAVEFYLSQRGPDLLIVVAGGNKRTPSRVTWVRPIPMTGRHVFGFGVLLENRGPVAARWIKVRIQVQMIEGMQTPRLEHLDYRGGSITGDWESPSMGLSTTFFGNDGFVSYPRRKRVPFLTDWLDNLGQFNLHTELRDQHEGMLAILEVSVWADRFGRHDQSIELYLEGTDN